VEECCSNYRNSCWRSANVIFDWDWLHSEAQRKLH